MSKLWLKFKDETGEEKRVEVDRTPFTIGRHSGCDLTIADSRLSRDHVRIEWRTDKFVISDAGSSNGTTLNGEKLAEPVGLKNEDALNLGGGIDMIVEIEVAEPDKPVEPEPSAALAADISADASAPAAALPGGDPLSASASSGGGIPTAFFIVAPLLGLFVLIAVIGAIVLFGGGQRQIASNTDGYDQTNDDDVVTTGDKDDDDDTPKPVKSTTPFASGTPSNDGPIATSSPASGGTELPPTVDTSDTAKVERNGAAFVRQIAQNDPKAFLTGDQAAKVSVKVKQFGRSSALADNLNSARKNAGAIRTLAAQKNLKPQFLAAAAITKLGSGRGDVLQAAQSVAEIYDQLRIQIGNENFDDALLMVAAFDQGAAGDSMKMRNMLQDLATKSSEGARTVRSIWFLEKNGKITAAEFERALNFLAIGTIAQNPKEFGVNAEALRL